ncbi:SEL1-like repeat protein [uncultured Tateyamaria sp.]|uniref:SEL1-like repeat protein n=1 Tax=Tateyamaria sp. 1078 TaxID=3417464 RepID=UPI002617D7F5|nr:SEL1-like repeat protein [uncultured Tateyamaria sp.]
MTARRVAIAAVLLVAQATAPLAQDTGADRFAQGMAHHSGDGVLQDYRAAAGHIRAAAEQGYAPAANMLGRYHFEGLGVARDRAQALRWLEVAADTGEPNFVFDLAQVLETDPATTPRAATLYATAAQAGLADAAVNLGVLYQQGRGVAQDYDRARSLYDGPAANGHPRALNNLGLLYVRANGVPQDYARAADLFAQAAEQGLAQAMTNLAVLYENGFGVPLDEARAAELYRAAGQGTARPPDYVYDPRLVPLTLEVEAAALVALVQTGDPVAQFQWAWLVLTDAGSDLANRTDAARLLQRTAHQGHGPSMFNLGLLYMRGIGVPQDYVLGHQWLLLAQVAGVAEAGAALDATASRLTVDQVNEAQRRAHTYTQ